MKTILSTIAASLLLCLTPASAKPLKVFILAEIILLGVLAQRFKTHIEWDAKAGRITNRPDLNAFVKESVRPGWGHGEDLWKQG